MNGWVGGGSFFMYHYVGDWYMGKEEGVGGTFWGSVTVFHACSVQTCIRHAILTCNASWDGY